MLRLLRERRRRDAPRGHPLPLEWQEIGSKRPARGHPYGRGARGIRAPHRRISGWITGDSVVLVRESMPRGHAIPQPDEGTCRRSSAKLRSSCSGRRARYHLCTGPEPEGIPSRRRSGTWRMRRVLRRFTVCFVLLAASAAGAPPAMADAVSQDHAASALNAVLSAVAIGSRKARAPSPCSTSTARW